LKETKSTLDKERDERKALEQQINELTKNISNFQTDINQLRDKLQEKQDFVNNMR